jgi:hypothetical protein
MSSESDLKLFMNHSARSMITWEFLMPAMYGFWKKTRNEERENEQQVMEQVKSIRAMVP